MANIDSIGRTKTWIGVNDLAVMLGFVVTLSLLLIQWQLGFFGEWGWWTYIILALVITGIAFGASVVSTMRLERLTILFTHQVDPEYQVDKEAMIGLGKASVPFPRFVAHRLRGLKGQQNLFEEEFIDLWSVGIDSGLKATLESIILKNSEQERGYTGPKQYRLTDEGIKSMCSETVKIPVETLEKIEFLGQKRFIKSADLIDSLIEILGYSRAIWLRNAVKRTSRLYRWDTNAAEYHDPSCQVPLALRPAQLNEGHFPEKKTKHRCLKSSRQIQINP